MQDAPESQKGNLNDLFEAQASQGFWQGLCMGQDLFSLAPREMQGRNRYCFDCDYQLSLVVSLAGILQRNRSMLVDVCGVG